ncbi:MAG: EpsI family protein [Moraxellaceae bacterium]|nr:MAG: EpsI family protein [Moraxellaceae bacterium]
MSNAVLAAIKPPLFLLLAWCAIWFGVFYETLISVASVWMNDNTYMHCFFVIPIALYFAYERKHLVLEAKPKPAIIMLVPFFGLQGLWLLGYAADVELFKHAAVFGMLPCAVVMFLGFQIAKILWFPLCFVVFSIPLGGELVPLFQVITADMSVQFLQWSGVAVYRDGLFITIPDGLFEVAEACSGVRFFVACVVLGSVIAYVSYTAIWKRILFLLFAIILPILANGLRAYGTIMVGHLIDMKYASAADHLIYGWGFFAFVVMILVLSSKIGADPDAHAHTNTGAISLHKNWASTHWPPIAFASILPLVFTAAMVLGLSNVTSSVHFDVAKQPGQTMELDSVSWKPQFTNPASEHFGRVDRKFDYYLAGYNDGEPDKELVSSNNRFFDIKTWRYITASTISLTAKDIEQPINARLLQIGTTSGHKRLVLHWYLLPNYASSRGIQIKLMQAVNVLLGKGDAGVAVAISIPYGLDLESDKTLLLQYANEYTHQLHKMAVFN